MYSSAIKYIKQRIEISDKELEAALRFSIFKGYAKHLRKFQKKVVIIIIAHVMNWTDIIASLFRGLKV